MSTLQELKQRIVNDIPITTIVGQYLPLTRKGTSTLAVCPFHDDHKPSMNVTDDRKRFGWDLSDVNQLQIEDLTRYLKGRVKKQIMNAGRTLSANTVQTTAVLAVDVELKYIHVRPVLHALAQARISHYGFETKHLNL